MSHRTIFDSLFAYFETREVDQHDVDLLLTIHRNDWLLPQIESKLQLLNPDDPVHSELHRLVRLSVALLVAVDANEYVPPNEWTEIEPHLKKAVVYFVKSGDAIPDCEPAGFDDDHREFLELAGRAERLLSHFETFHLRSQ